MIYCVIVFPDDGARAKVMDKINRVYSLGGMNVQSQFYGSLRNLNSEGLDFGISCL